MSSGLLYLAIVGVWALVLVPMWVRSSDAGEERALGGEVSGAWRSAFRRLVRPDPMGEEEPAEDDVGARPGDGHAEGPVGGAAGSAAALVDDAAAAHAVRPPRRTHPASLRDDVYPARRQASHARIIARRRRRLTGIALLTVAAMVLSVSGVAEWWVVPAPALLLVTYLACLRAASDYDRELRARRLARAAAVRRRAEMAEVVAGPGRTDTDDAPREQLFDQYAPPARAVGD